MSLVVAKADFALGILKGALNPKPVDAVFDQLAGRGVCAGIAQGIVGARVGSFVGVLPRQGPPEPGALLLRIPKPNALADAVHLDPSAGAVTHFEPLSLRLR